MAPDTLSPETLLADWRAQGLPFRRRPRLLARLGGGRSNASYLLEADGARLVLRLDGVGAALRPDADDERRFLEAAAARGLAPALVHADPARGLLLTAYAEGEQLTPAGLDDTRLGALLELLDAVRALEIEAGVTDYRALVARYAAGAPAAGPAALAALEPHLAMLEAGADRGTCHHDPGPANVVFTPRGPLLLDWEYAGRGFPLLDLAVLATDWEVPLAHLAALTATPPRLLAAGCGAYRVLCGAWEAGRSARLAAPG
jgi:aminoglycoside phosphotransferase (APT) family kinase protein